MALSLTTSIALATILFFVYKFATRSKSTKNSLPEPWRLPIIGHMHHLIGTIPHRGVMDLARKYGSLMHLQLGEVSTIVVSSPKWAKEILTTYDITFANRPETLTGEIVAYHNTDIVLAPYGEYWRQLRKLCTLELLSVKKVKSFQSLREEECWNLVQEIKASGSGRPVNLSENIFKLIATILSRAAFGKGIKDQKEFTEIVKEILRQTGGFDVADIFPSKKFLHHLSGKRARLTSIHQKLDNLINNLVAEHTVKTSSKTNETLLDVLLRLKDSAEFPLTADNVKAIILDMFGAGTDTSSATIEWAISELIKCPRAMEKVQVELRKALNGKERIHEEDIQELSYLNLVIKETLRLHPPLPLVMPRECRQPVNLAGYDIPNKTKLIVNVFAINRDPEYWKDAETFIPERFENSSTTVMGAEYEYLPFGAGRRMCPGAALGLANVQLPLANILYHFNWKLPNGASYDQIDMTESFGATVQRKTELLLVPSF
uniref:Germacrene A hydroxylase n=1 Tax=Tanacetum parthenium TaxID=127999 RepID=GAO_TANPA|nr:RecName: Full=Germacrene A hydroxylase; AltName: Full=Germacrene A oxidase; Short=TpGAO [Tanacetum parthenium]AHN62855.1 germacrene A oxidase [Tanacetum parthenium]